MSFVTVIRDYVQDPDKIVSILDFALFALRELIWYIFSFQWLRTLTYVTLVTPHSFFEGLFQNKEHVLDTSNQVLNSFFDTLPLINLTNLKDEQVSFLSNIFYGIFNGISSTFHGSIVTILIIHALLYDGKKGAFKIAAASCLGDMSFILAILFGFRGIIIPWLALEPLAYLVGFALQVFFTMQIIQDNRRITRFNRPYGRGVFFKSGTLAAAPKILPCLVAFSWCEQTQVFQTTGVFSLQATATSLDLCGSLTGIPFGRELQVTTYLIGFAMARLAYIWSILSLLDKMPIVLDFFKSLPTALLHLPDTLLKITSNPSALRSKLAAKGNDAYLATRTNILWFLNLDFSQKRQFINDYLFDTLPKATLFFNRLLYPIYSWLLPKSLRSRERGPISGMPVTDDATGNISPSGEIALKNVGTINDRGVFKDLLAALAAACCALLIPAYTTNYLLAKPPGFFPQETRFERTVVSPWDMPAKKLSITSPLTPPDTEPKYVFFSPFYDKGTYEGYFDKSEEDVRYKPSRIWETRRRRLTYNQNYEDFDFTKYDKNIIINPKLQDVDLSKIFFRRNLPEETGNIKQNSLLSSLNTPQHQASHSGSSTITGFMDNVYDFIKQPFTLKQKPNNSSLLKATPLPLRSSLPSATSKTTSSKTASLEKKSPGSDLLSTRLQKWDYLLEQAKVRKTYKKLVGKFDYFTDDIFGDNIFSYQKKPAFEPPDKHFKTKAAPPGLKIHRSPRERLEIVLQLEEEAGAPTRDLLDLASLSNFDTMDEEEIDDALEAFFESQENNTNLWKDASIKRSNRDKPLASLDRGEEGTNPVPSAKANVLSPKNWTPLPIVDPNVFEDRIFEPREAGIQQGMWKPFTTERLGKMKYDYRSRFYSKTLDGPEGVSPYLGNFIFKSREDGKDDLKEKFYKNYAKFKEARKEANEDMSMEKRFTAWTPYRSGEISSQRSYLLDNPHIHDIDELFAPPVSDTVRYHILEDEDDDDDGEGAPIANGILEEPANDPFEYPLYPLEKNNLDYIGADHVFRDQIGESIDYEREEIRAKLLKDPIKHFLLNKKIDSLLSRARSNPLPPAKAKAKTTATKSEISMATSKTKATNLEADPKEMSTDLEGMHGKKESGELSKDMGFDYLRDKDLFKRRLMLFKYADSVNLLKPKVSHSFMDRIYDHQFKGTLSNARRLFSLKIKYDKPSIVSKDYKTGIRHEGLSDSVTHTPNKSQNSVGHEDQNLNDLKRTIIKDNKKDGVLDVYLNSAPFYTAWDPQSRKLTLSNRYLDYKSTVNAEQDTLSSTSAKRINNRAKGQQKNVIQFTSWPLRTESLHDKAQALICGLYEKDNPGPDDPIEFDERERARPLALPRRVTSFDKLNEFINEDSELQEMAMDGMGGLKTYDEDNGEFVLRPNSAQFSQQFLRFQDYDKKNFLFLSHWDEIDDGNVLFSKKLKHQKLASERAEEPIGAFYRLEYESDEDEDDPEAVPYGEPIASYYRAIPPNHGGFLWPGD